MHCRAPSPGLMVQEGACDTLCVPRSTMTLALAQVGLRDVCCIKGAPACSCPPLTIFDTSGQPLCASIASRNEVTDAAASCNGHGDGAGVCWGGVATTWRCHARAGKRVSEHALRLQLEASDVPCARACPVQDACRPWPAACCMPPTWSWSALTGDDAPCASIASTSAYAGCQRREEK